MGLKPCPFCGSKRVHLHIHDDGGWWVDSITCVDCGIGFSTGCFGGGIDVGEVEEMSAKAWNRRV